MAKIQMTTPIVEMTLSRTIMIWGLYTETKRTIRSR